MQSYRKMVNNTYHSLLAHVIVSFFAHQNSKKKHGIYVYRNKNETFFYAYNSNEYKPYLLNNTQCIQFSLNRNSKIEFILFNRANNVSSKTAYWIFDGTVETLQILASTTETLAVIAITIVWKQQPSGFVFFFQIRNFSIFLLVYSSCRDKFSHLNWLISRDALTNRYQTKQNREREKKMTK